MEPCYVPFNISDWQTIEVIEERAATQDDVNRCNAIFAVGEGQSEPVSTPGLPALALLTIGAGREREVVIVQIENRIGSEMTMVGYVLPGGGNGIGLLSEFRIIEYAK
jgi:hypothetical protein